jgi:hypothetical protein
MRNAIAPGPIAVTSWRPHATICNVLATCRKCKAVSHATSETLLWHATTRKHICAAAYHLVAADALRATRSEAF